MLRICCFYEYGRCTQRGMYSLDLAMTDANILYSFEYLIANSDLSKAESTHERLWEHASHHAFGDSIRQKLSERASYPDFMATKLTGFYFLFAEPPIIPPSHFSLLFFTFVGKTWCSRGDRSCLTVYILV